MSISVIKKKGINPLTKAVLYFLKWTRKGTSNGLKLAKRMARGGSYSIGETIGMMHDFPEYVFDELLEGNAVYIEGLGTFKLKVTGKAKAKKEDVSIRDAKIQVIYEPDQTLISRLNDEAEFEYAKVITEEGKKDIEDSSTSDSSTGDDYVLDTSTGETVDTSTGTVDTSTNAEPEGDDGLGG